MGNLRAPNPGFNSGQPSVGNKLPSHDRHAGSQSGPRDDPPHRRGGTRAAGCAVSRMTPQEREEALERREANAAILSAKLEKDRVALESEIAASAAASKAASAINRALQADAAKRVKELEAECAQWEAKLARLKSEVGRLAPAEAPPPRREEESPSEKAAVAAAKAQLANDRATFEAEKEAFERENAVSEGPAQDRGPGAGRPADQARRSVRSELESGVKTREAEVKRKEVSLEAERTKLQAGVDSLMRAEKQQSEERAKLDGGAAGRARRQRSDVRGADPPAAGSS